MASVVLDAGHGGSDPGAVFNGRQEKDDVLRLTRAVGEILENSGVDVFYTRTDDVYETPFQKAMDANATGADFLISIHRNSGVNPNTYNGAQTLVFDDSGVRSSLARNINDRLVEVGFNDIGIEERPNLAILRRSQMPAALVEVGFINNDVDNRIFDERFNAIAQGIAEGILASVYGSQGSDDEYESDEAINRVVNEMDMNMDMNRMDMNEMDVYRPGMMSGDRQPMMSQEMMSGSRMQMVPPEDRKLYRVQVGAYRNRENADRMLNTLLSEGFPAFMIYDDGLYRVQVGAYEFLPNAIRMENQLRQRRYNTYITT